MPSMLTRLKTAGCRIDGLLIASDGTPSFAATHAAGEWSAAEKDAVMAALGRRGAVVSSERAAAVAAIERWLDRTAQALGYNNFVTATSYAGSAVDLWQRQARALATWRDAVWQAALARLDRPADLPASEAEFIAALPQPNIPTS